MGFLSQAADVSGRCAVCRRQRGGLSEVLEEISEVRGWGVEGDNPPGQLLPWSPRDDWQKADLSTPSLPSC